MPAVNGMLQHHSYHDNVNLVDNASIADFALGRRSCFDQHGCFSMNGNHLEITADSMGCYSCSRTSTNVARPDLTKHSILGSVD